MARTGGHAIREIFRQAGADVDVDMARLTVRQVRRRGELMGYRSGNDARNDNR